jgi:hypothetical protein
MNYGDYMVTCDLPSKPSRPLPPRDPTPEKARQWALDLERYNEEKLAYDVARVVYEEKVVCAKMKFKSDILKLYGLTDHPKADAIFNMAWEEGHSAGLATVDIWVAKLMDLVK